MDGCDRSGQALMVRLSPAGRFYQGLAVMKELSESAVLLLRAGEVELRASSPSGVGIASMIINASAAFPPSSSSRSFAYRFNVLDLMDLLGSEISESDSRSLWISRMVKSPALRFLIGISSIPIQFSEVEEVSPFTSDLRALQLLPYRVILPSKYLRKVITACASDENADFHLSYTGNRVTWTTSNSKTVHQIKGRKCVVEGADDGVERRFVVEWLGFREALVEASQEAGVVVMSPVGSPGMSNWIAFLFRFNEGSHLMFLVRGLKNPCSSPVAEDEDSYDDDEDEDEDSDSNDDEDGVQSNCDEDEDKDSDSNDDEDGVQNNYDEDEDEDSDSNDDEDGVQNSYDEDEDEDSDSNDDEDGVQNSYDEDEDEDSNNDDEDEEDDVHSKDDEDDDGWILV